MTAIRMIDCLLRNPLPRRFLATGASASVRGDGIGGGGGGGAVPGRGGGGGAPPGGGGGGGAPRDGGRNFCVGAASGGCLRARICSVGGSGGCGGR